MKSSIAIVLFFIAILPSYSQENYLKIDGYKWDTMSEGMKIGFVQGWIYAYSALGDLAPNYYYALLLYTGIKKEITGVPVTDKLSEYLGELSDVFRCASYTFVHKKGVGFVNITVGQISSAIDEIYKDPRVKNWEIDEIMPLVRGRLKEGWTSNELDNVISFLIKEKNLFGKENEWTAEKIDSLYSSEPQVLRNQESLYDCIYEKIRSKKK